MQAGALLSFGSMQRSLPSCSIGKAAGSAPLAEAGEVDASVSPAQPCTAANTLLRHCFLVRLIRSDPICYIDTKHRHFVPNFPSVSGPGTRTMLGSDTIEDTFGQPGTGMPLLVPGAHWMLCKDAQHMP